MRVFVSTVPFGANTDRCARLLADRNCEVVINPLNRKLSANELEDFIEDFDYLIAGTEQITSRALKRAKKLKLIARVGIGLDGIALITAREMGIAITYTPDAPTEAVTDLTIALMGNLTRGVNLSDSLMRRGEWRRVYGKGLSDTKIGLIGFGRIGKGVYRKLAAMGASDILINDIDSNVFKGLEISHQVSLSELLRDAELISIHTPLTNLTRNMISYTELAVIRDGGFLVNTSRGGIVNETALADSLKSGKLGGAAVDVFETEPYIGPLCGIPNTILTAHMGSMTFACRDRMEFEATMEVCRHLDGESLLNPVPTSEIADQL